MARIIYDPKERLLTWASAHTDTGEIPADAHAIGVERDGEIIAVVYYVWFTDYNCTLHVVSDGGATWLSREFLAHVFAYPFGQLKLRRVTAFVASRNERALTMDYRLGFEVEGVMKHGAGDDDIIVMGMLRENCVWIPESMRHG